MSGVHLHLIMSHIPVAGIFIGILLLLWGLVRRSDEVVGASHMLFVAMAAATVATFLTGEPAEAVAKTIVGVQKSSIERHEDAAKIASILIYLVGGASFIGLVFAGRFRCIRGALRVGVLALALIASGVLGWTANLGGQIRHSEIAGTAPVAASMNDHD